MSINPSFTKPFYLLPRGGGGGGGFQLCQNRCTHEPEILQGIRDTFESFRNVKVVYLVTIATPQRRGVLGENR